VMGAKFQLNWRPQLSQKKIVPTCPWTTSSLKMPATCSRESLDGHHLLQWNQHQLRLNANIAMVVLPLAIIDCHTFNENKGNLLPLAEGRDAMIIMPTTNQPYLSSTLHETFRTAVSSGIVIQCYNLLDKQNTPTETLTTFTQV